MGSFFIPCPNLTALIARVVSRPGRCIRWVMCTFSEPNDPVRHQYCPAFPISGSPPRSSALLPWRVMRPRPRSKPRPSRRSSAAAISAASPRPGPARQPPSRCPFSSVSARPQSDQARHTCRTLVLAPTRELASQIAESFRTYGRGMPLSTAVAFGGVPLGAQQRQLARGVDILVATPGRLLDLIDRQALTLSNVQILVLDEADRMLDLGFIHALKRIVKLLPRQRQTLLFSATMPRSIASLAEEYLSDPLNVAVTPAATTVELRRSERRVCRECRQAEAARDSCCGTPPSRECSSSPEQSTVRIGSSAICIGRQYRSHRHSRQQIAAAA